MSGPRYTDWSHIDHGGDPEAAAPYISEARKLLGFVMEDAAHNSLGSHKLQRRLPDGAVITAEKIGEQVRMKIKPPPRGGEDQPERTPEDFVVWARDDAHPDGIDFEHPQQILRSPGEAWKTFFFDGDIAGFDDFGGPKGTYIGQFPDGIRHAGNVDWTDERGERLSWYGPSTRYFMEPYVQPDAQYGKFVFQLGQIVLDMDAYILDSTEQPTIAERWIFGAAKRGIWLYVIHGGLFHFNTPPTTFPRKDGVIVSPSQSAESDLVLSRFLLAGAAPFLTVVPNSREELWRQTRVFPMQPWFFNASCTKAVCHALPPGIVFAPADYPIFDVSTEHQFLTLDIDVDEGTATFSEQPVSLANEAGQSAAIATDFIVDEPIELKIAVTLRPSNPFFPPDVLCYDLQVGESEPIALVAPLWRQGAFPEQGNIARYLVHADLRTGVAVLMRTTDWYLVIPNNEPIEAEIEIWLKGALRTSRALPRNPADLATDGGFYSLGLVRPNNYITSVALASQQTVISPLLVLFGVFAEVYRIEFGIVFFNVMYGLHHIGYYLMSRPTSEWFGGFKPSRRFPESELDDPDPLLLVVDYVKPGPANLQLDFDGHHDMVGAASTEDAMVFSMSLPQDAAAFVPPFSIHAVTDGQLPALTGVVGENARYHPIWRLGKPPLAP